jgi:phosphoglycolate phosphatase
VRRLLLFDIDGTLLLGGPAKTAFEEAMIAVFGTAGPIESHSFSGKTDPQIARELLERAGLTGDDIDEGLPRLFRRYLAGLEAGLDHTPMRALPGVAQLMDRLKSIDEVALGLVTGNVRQGAQLKLRSAALEHHFHIGGFGSDHEHRNELPGIAIHRAERHWGVSFDEREVVVIGDTPRDIECGRAHRTRTVAVATGHYTMAELDAHGPDVVFESFAEVERVVEALVD